MMNLKYNLEKRCFLLVILSIFVCYSCSNNKIEQPIVLKIKNLEITKYEFEKNKNKALAANNYLDISEWKDGYKEKCMIIADAYEQNYDTMQNIRKGVNYLSNFMMVKKDGYLWQETISPIVNEGKQVTKDDLEKRTRKILFDYISCEDLEELSKILGKDFEIINLDEFNSLKAKCQFNDFLFTGRLTIQWPFFPFWDSREEIYKLKKGELSHILRYNDRYYYLYVVDINSIGLTMQDRNKLQQELQMGIENELDEKKTEEMIQKSRPILVNRNINTIAQFISTGHSLSEFKHNLELINYWLNASLKKVHFKTFLEYYSYLPLKNTISDKKTLTNYINQFFYDDFLRDEAEKLGLYDSERFLLDRKYYKNNLMYDKYIRNNIINKVKVDNSEILNNYEKNRHTFVQPKIVTFDMYVFEKKGEALANSDQLLEAINGNNNKAIDDPTSIKGLVKIRANTKINLETDTLYSKEFIAMLLVMNDNMLSKMPIKYNDKYVLLYKSKVYGESIKPLKYVYGEIERSIKDEKIDLERKKLVGELKKKYRFEIDKTL